MNPLVFFRIVQVYVYAFLPALPVSLKLPHTFCSLSLHHSTHTVTLSQTIPLCISINPLNNTFPVSYNKGSPPHVLIQHAFKRCFLPGRLSSPHTRDLPPEPGTKSPSRPKCWWSTGALIQHSALSVFTATGKQTFTLGFLLRCTEVLGCLQGK